MTVSFEHKRLSVAESARSVVSADPASLIDPTTGDVPHDLNVTNDIPSAEAQALAAQLPVWGSNGESILFSHLYGEKRTMVIFIRHFLCGICQQYLQCLSASFGPRDLYNLRSPSSLVVIGCGSPELIAGYRQRTGCLFPIYADPTRRLYDILGMTQSLSPGDKHPAYQKKSAFTTTMSSIWQGFKIGALAFKAGSIRQVGGEFLYEKDTVKWCHRMRNTRDHVEADELRTVLGLSVEPDTNGVYATAPFVPGETRKPFKPIRSRRSMSVGQMVNRLSGDWSRIGGTRDSGINGICLVETNGSLSGHTIRNGTTQEAFNGTDPIP